MTVAQENSSIFALPDGALRGRAVKGVMSTGVSQATKLVVQFGSVVLLARLLSPAQFGLYAMVTPIVGFATLFQDFGLTQAVVTSNELTHSHATAIFRFNLLLSFGIAVAMVVCAPLLGLLYRQPDVTPLAALMAVQLLFAGSAATHRALLNRAMQFQKIAAVEVASTLLGFGVGVAIALWRPSAYALAGMSLCTALVGAAGSWVASGWVPKGSSSIASVRSMLTFGRHMATFNLLNFLSRNADNVLIGWARGAAELGLYDRAYKLMLFPLQQINTPVSNVMVPLLSRIRNEPERYRAAYMRTVQIMLLVTMPGMVVLLLTADRLIPFLMGEKWRGVVPIFVWLGVSGIYQTFSNTFGWLFVSQGRASEYSKFGMYSTACCLIAFVAGLPWGGLGVAIAYAVSGLVLRTPPMIWLLGRSGPIGWRELLWVFTPHLVAASCAALAWSMLRPFLGRQDLLFLISSAVLVYTVAWASLLFWPQGRAAFREGVQLLQSMTNRRGRPA